jgi:glycosyltransferase involved in cell wall biosynthesis
MILRQTLPSYLDFNNIFVWDNNSTPPNKIALKVFEKKNRNLKVFWNKENVGWPKALNRMIIEAPTDWVLITAEDMLFGKNVLQDVNKLVEWKPNLEQIYLFTFDSMLFHKKTFARFGWWEERQNQVQPVAEDDDWYLRLVEHLGFSPYVYPGEHIVGKERRRRLKVASTQEIMERMDNISYFCNCRWGISSVNVDVKEITRAKDYLQTYTAKQKGEPGIAFHRRKWKETGKESDLLNKDGTFWKRKLEEEDFYPDIRKELQEKYL